MKKVIICILLTAFLFGTMEVALKSAGDSFDSVQLTFLRFLIGGIILAPFGIREVRRRGTIIHPADLGWLFLVGCMGIPVSMLCFQLGVERCNAATAASLICLNPLFTMVEAHLFTSEKMDRLKAVAFGIGVVAAVFMIRPWDIQPGNTVAGMALMLVASVTFAAYTVMGKKTIGRIGTFAQTSISFVLGSLVLLVVLLITGRPVVAGVAESPLLVLYCGVFVTGLGYLFYFIAIKYSDATTGSIAFFIKPAIAPVLALVLLHESILWNTIVGVVLLISASLLTLYDTYNQRTLDEVATERQYEHELDEIFATRKPKTIDKRRYFACMIPLVEIDGKEHMVLESRNRGVLFNQGEVCFPGGELRPEEAPDDCAIRETVEELGIDRKALHIINQMDTYHGLTGVKMYCFVGRLDTADFHPDPEEVQETILVPVEYLIEKEPEMHHLDIVQEETDDTLAAQIARNGNNYRWMKGRREIPIYNYYGVPIWGIPAMIIMDFAAIVKKARKKR